MDQQTRFLTKLQPSGWDRVLEGFVMSPHFAELMDALKKANDTTGITPQVSQIFRAFYECPYEDLKVIIIGQDPYPEKGVADGISFSCSNTMRVQPSLRVMFKEIEETVYPQGYNWNPDLTRWSNQGILMLNTAMTTVPGKIGMHYDMWKPFTKYLFTELAARNTGLIYVFMGAAAKNWATLVPESNYKLYCYHPASASYSKGVWESNDLFNRVNQILMSNNNLQITW